MTQQLTLFGAHGEPGAARRERRHRLVRLLRGEALRVAVQRRPGPRLRLLQSYRAVIVQLRLDCQSPVTTVQLLD